MKKLIKGVLIGISYVLPGVCSSTTANSMGEYENILELTGNFYSVNVLRKHCKLGFGVLLGIMIALLSLNYFFLNNIFWI